MTAPAPPPAPSKQEMTAAEKDAAAAEVAEERALRAHATAAAADPRGRGALFGGLAAPPPAARAGPAPPPAPRAGAPEVVRFSVTRRAVSAAATPLRELFGLDALPLAEARVAIELRGVPTAAVNALRRAVTDEMPGRCLRVPAEGFDADATTEVLMLPQFVNQRIALLPLRPQIPPEVVKGLRLRLDVANPSASVRPVYAGDLRVVAGAMPEPLFNPTFRLAVLQPGKRLVVDGIHLASGAGRDDAAFCVARCAAFSHLDLPQAPREETHLPGGSAVDLSGYAVSCLVADPRHHRLTAVLPAAGPDPAEARATFADACAALLERLRLVAQVVERGDEPAPRGALFTAVRLESGRGAGLEEGRLQVPGETHSVGELLRRAVFDLEPAVAFVGYTVAPHEGGLALTLRHAGPTAPLLLRAARACIATFEALRRGIASAPA